MRLVVIGAKGMLGTDMRQDGKSDEVIAVDSSEVDIRDLEQVRTLASKVRPDWIVLTVAESRPQTTSPSISSGTRAPLFCGNF